MIPHQMKAESRKGVFTEEKSLRECWSNESSWAPHRRRIYTCPLYYPDDAQVTPFQARLFFNYLQGPAPKELFELGAFILDEVAAFYQERVTVGFEFLYTYPYEQYGNGEILMRMAKPICDPDRAYTPLDRENDVMCYLSFAPDGRLRACFAGPPSKNAPSTYVYGTPAQIARRFVTKISKVIPKPA